MWTDLSESQTATIPDWWQKNDFIAHKQICVIYLKKIASISFERSKWHFKLYWKNTVQHTFTHFLVCERVKTHIAWDSFRFER